MNALIKFATWLALDEMSARRSFQRSLGKFEPLTVGKPVATLTAWRGTLSCAGDQPCPEPERRRRNDLANRRLAANLQRRGLSFYPVIGVGQETVAGRRTVNKEAAFVVQPQETMLGRTFLNHIQELLFNPTGEGGDGPFAHTQYGAIVKLPGDPEAYLLHHPDAMLPTRPQDYRVMDALGSTAGRRHNEPYFTQMKFGPRADISMIDDLDKPGDMGNPWPGSGRPGAGLPGKRFVVKNKIAKADLTHSTAPVR
jgi:hypothetical protein